MGGGDISRGRQQQQQQLQQRGQVDRSGSNALTSQGAITVSFTINGKGQSAQKKGGEKNNSNDIVFDETGQLNL